MAALKPKSDLRLAAKEVKKEAVKETPAEKKKEEAPKEVKPPGSLAKLVEGKKKEVANNVVVPPQPV